MVKTKDTPKCKYYAAKVVTWHRQRKGLMLKFHGGNIYSNGDAPDQSNLVLKIQSVKEARENSWYPRVQDNLGAIKWPVEYI